MDYKKIWEKLEEEKQGTAWLNTRLREKIRDRERSYHKGFVGMDQQTYRDLQDWDEGYHREHEGVMAGLDWAMDIVERGEAGLFYF